MYIDPIQTRIEANELNHHGILGMKWGIRRFQPYPKDYEGKGKEIGDAKRSAKDIQKDLNKAEKAYKRHAYEYQNANTRIENLNKGALKITTKAANKVLDPNSRKGRRTTTKLNLMGQMQKQQGIRRDRAEKNLKTIESDIWRLLAEATTKGYSFNNIKKTSYKDYDAISRRKSVISSLMIGPIPGTISSAVKRQKGYNEGTRDQGQYIQYNKWKVKDDHKGVGLIRDANNKMLSLTNTTSLASKNIGQTTMEEIYKKYTSPTH